MINETLLWEKYRPQTLEELILPDHVTQVVKDGIKTNMLFVGPPGVGKTTLARVLANTGGHPVMEISAGSEDNAVEKLRTDVESFVGRYDLITAEADKHKVLILDEFERASKQLQISLQSFIERHSAKVRIILCANASSLLNDAMHSRVKTLSFEFKGQNAQKQAKIKLAKRLSHIAEEEGYDVSQKELIAHVQKYFPDFRRSIEELQFSQTEIESTQEQSLTDLYELLLKDTPAEVMWEFIYSKYDLNYDMCFRGLGRPFFGSDGYLKQRHPDLYAKVLLQLSYKYRNAMSEWHTSPDPLVLLNCLCFEYQEAIKKVK